MASMTLQKQNVMPIPQEVVQMICKYLDRPDLKNARLSSKQLNDAAEMTLFRYIYLRRNMDSFCGLPMLVSAPHLARLVKGIVYSSRMLQDSCSVNSEEWREMYFGQGFFSPIPQEVSVLSKACSMADLHLYYWNWCGEFHSQWLMRRFDIEGKDLDAFSKLPKLEEICFGACDRYLNGPKPTTEHRRPLGRNMWVEPNNIRGIQYHVEQFTAMMAAATKTNKSLKVIKAFGLPIEAFEQDHEVSAMMNERMRHCKRFKVTAHQRQRRKNSELQIGTMLRHAPHLRTIEIAFPKAPLQPLETVADLSRLSVQQSRWPNLERLQLQWFSTSDMHLRGVLTAHAAPLTSLALSHINLRPHVSNGKIHDSFWVGFILFLRESLNLHEMHFLNSLTNEGNENWNIVEPTLAA